MRLKPEIQDVLDKLGVEQNQIDALIGYFTAQLAAYEKADAKSLEEVAKLHKRLDAANEELAKTVRMREGIAKFVVYD